MYDAGKLDIAIENTLLDMALFEKELTAAYEEMDAIRIGTRFIDRDLKTVTEQRDDLIELTHLLAKALNSTRWDSPVICDEAMRSYEKYFKG